MNVDRLLEISDDIRNDLQTTNAATLLQQLTGHLQNSINQPNQPQHDQQFQRVYQQLLTALESAPSNGFTPAWRQAAEEIGAGALLGRDLAVRVREAVERNGITKPIALQELQELQAPLQNLSTGVQELSNALKKLGFKPSTLEPGQGELRIVVPREFVENHLGDFAKELGKLDFYFGSLARLAAEDHRKFPLRAIASSNLEVIIGSAPMTLWIFGKCVDKLLSWIRESLEIRKTWNELKDREVPVPQEVLSGLEEHANNLIGEKISSLREELIAEHATSRPAGERHELGNAIEAALKQLAYRFDRGFQVEVRIEPLPEPEPDEAEAEEARGTREAIAAVSELAPRLQYLRPEGDPILRLPEESGAKGGAS